LDVGEIGLDRLVVLPRAAVAVDAVAGLTLRRGDDLHQIRLRLALDLLPVY